MKKLLITLLFIGMFSKVSLSQIWESDTLPSQGNTNRYFAMAINKELTNISFFSGNISLFPTTFNNHSIWSNNFGNDFKKSSISNCCVMQYYKEEVTNKIKLLNDDTILVYYNTPLYSSNIFSSTGGIRNTPLGVLKDSGKALDFDISVRHTISRFSPGFGVAPLDLEYIRSFHLFNRKMAIVSLKANPYLDGFLDNDTFSSTGFWKAGQPYQPIQLGIKYPVTDFEFIHNDSLGFAVSYGNYIAKSRDKGLTWERTPPPPIRADWEDLFFIDSLHGWVYGRVLKDSSMNGFRSIPVAINTFDGGNTWFQITCDTNYTWRNKWFNRLGFGWAIRDSVNNGPSELVKTTDYGNSWTVQLSSRTERLEDMAFADTANGLIFSNFRNVSNNPPSKIYIKTSSTMGTFKKYLPKLELYPNPTSSRFKLRGYKEEEGLTLRLFNNSGKEVWRGVPSPEGEVDISNLSPGLYHVEALTSSGKRWSTRVVRE